MVRAFICIDIPRTVKDKIGALQNELKSFDAQVSWVKTPNIHITLRFLGGIPDSQIDPTVNVCHRAARIVRPFELEVGGVGCFPSRRSPRVLWVGIAEVPDDLRLLYESIEDSLAGIGFEKERRRFAPHLTIGRLRSQQNAMPLVEALQRHGLASERFQVKEIIVMRSDLNPKGAVYTPLAVIPIGATD
jgi:2'-5' RNA ligase